MKRSISILFPVLMMALAGCTKEEINTAKQSSDIDNRMIATIEETKTHLDGITMTWQKNDEFRVAGYNDWIINKETNYRRYVLDDEDAGKSKGTFTSENPVTAGQQSYFGIHGGSGYFSSDFYIKYSFKEDQNYVENGIEDGIMPLYAYGTSLDNMHVYYCGCIMKLQMYSSTDTYIKAIHVSSTKEITGQFHVAPKSAPENPCNGPAGNTGKVIMNLNISDVAGVKLSMDEMHPTAFNIVLPGYNVGDIIVSIVSSNDEACYVRKENFEAAPGKIYKMKAFEFTPSAPSHVLLAIDGESPVDLNVALTGSRTPENSVIVTTTDDEVVTNAELTQISGYIAKAKNSASVTLDLSSIKVPDNVFLAWFRNCKRVTTLILPTTVTQLGNSESNLFSNNLSNIVLNEGLKKIYSTTLSNYGGVLNLPSTVTDIAWRNTAKVQSIDVTPGGIFTAVNGVLFADDGKTLVGFPGGNTDEMYTHFSIPTGVTRIKTYCFQAVNNLIELTIPATVTTIDAGVFSECKSVKKIIVEAGLDAEGNPKTSLGGITYNDDGTAIGTFSETGDIYFPNDNQGKYRVAPGWVNFTTKRNWTVHDASVSTTSSMSLPTSFDVTAADLNYD